MAGTVNGGARWRNNPFERGSPSPAPASKPLIGRPQSMVITSPSTSTKTSNHDRSHSFSPANVFYGTGPQHIRTRSNSIKASHSSSGTFAPTFIKNDGGEKVDGIEGENDFSGKRYVWIRDAEAAFVRGFVVEELAGNMLLVQCDNGTVSEKLCSAIAEADRPVAARDPRGLDGQSQSSQV